MPSYRQKQLKTTSVAQLDLKPPSANSPTQDGNTTPSVQGPVQTATSSSRSQTSVGGTVSSMIPCGRSWRNFIMMQVPLCK